MKIPQKDEIRANHTAKASHILSRVNIINIIIKYEPAAPYVYTYHTYPSQTHHR